MKCSRTNSIQIPKDIGVADRILALCADGPYSILAIVKTSAIEMDFYTYWH